MNEYKPPKANEDMPSFMQGERFAVTCPHCQHQFNGLAKKTFLGFKKFTCPVCEENFSYPLFRAYRITYWLLLSAAIVFFFFSASSSQPSIFIILMGFAVLRDAYLLLRRK